MIFDKIANLKEYNLDLSFIEETLRDGIYFKGKFNINDPIQFGIGLEYTTKSSSEALWEAHRRYLDIHCILEGEEIIEISDISNMTASNEYVDDYQLFEGHPEQRLILRPGNFLLLFPNEVHKTSIKINDSSSVKKIVFKLNINAKP